MLQICVIWILIVLPYRPQVRHAHQTGSGRQVFQEDPEFQIGVGGVRDPSGISSLSTGLS